MSGGSIVNQVERTFNGVGQLTGELWWTVLEVTDGREHWRMRTQLPEGLRSLMAHARATDGSGEVIHQTEIRPRCWHTLRTRREPGKAWAVVMNSLTVEQPGPLTEGQDRCGGRSFEQLKGFGDVG